MTFSISDGNANKTASSIEEANEIVSEWYDFMLEENDFPELRDAIHSFDENNENLKELNLAIAEWEIKIAEACEYKSFAGHGNYFVNAADSMGLNLVVKEVEA